MNFETFLQMPTAEVALLVREDGPKVCVFPINGTRRWFMLEHPEKAKGKSWKHYMELTWQRQIELYKLFFDHGIDTLLTPVFGPDLLERGEDYQALIEPGLLWLSQNQNLLDFYNHYDVRVKVYGDARRCLAQTPYTHVLDTFEDLSKQTALHQSYRLFFGVCAHDATETVAEVSVNFYLKHGHLPNKRQIVEAYYGEYVSPVDIYIGFNPPTVFDMPLVATGNEDLYFTIRPSPYLDKRTLRLILYDHLFTRQIDDSDYSQLDAEKWQKLREFYIMNRHRTLGLGRKDESGKYWYPLPQAELPPTMKKSS
jgi:tuberculosinol/isotuberculosinol synthase